MNPKPFLGKPAPDTATCKSILSALLPGTDGWKRISKAKAGRLTIRTFTSAGQTIKIVTSPDDIIQDIRLSGVQPSPSTPGKSTAPTGDGLAYALEKPEAFALRLIALNMDKDVEGIDMYSILDHVDNTPDGGLQRIEFDLENWEADGDGFGDCPYVGLHTLGDFTFLGVTAGGDWEVPLFFILYPKAPGKVAGYIPTAGNVYNYESKSAFGNSEDSDEKIARMVYKCGAGNIPGLLDSPKLIEDIRKHFKLPKSAVLTKHDMPPTV